MNRTTKQQQQQNIKQQARWEVNKTHTKQILLQHTYIFNMAHKHEHIILIFIFHIISNKQKQN